MKALHKSAVMELKLFAREPAALFFVLALPLILLLLTGAQGNTPPGRGLDGVGAVDFLVPGYIAMVIATTGLMGLPETLASYREQGILRRQRATPVRPIVILGTHIIVNVIVTAIGLALLVLIGTLFYNLNMPIEPLGVVVAVLVSALSLFTLSFLFAGVVPTVRVAQAIGAALYFPMIFFSGATWPREALPDLARRIGDALPLTYAVKAMQDPWVGNGWNFTALAVLGTVLLVSTAISSRTFKWE